MTTIESLKAQHQDYCRQELALNMERGQPADANFDLSVPMLDILGASDTHTDKGIDIRNYPGGIAGLPEARELFCHQIGVAPDEIIIGNNSSLEMMSHVLGWALLKGVLGSARGWVHDKPKLIVTVPGYDRHFGLAQSLGYELVPVAMTAAGPDMDAVEELVANDSQIKGIYFVPTYSNPTGDSLSHDSAQRLVSMSCAAEDFTILADDAYAIHHLSEPDTPAPRLLALARLAGNANRVILFGSTSKVTFASGGLAFMGMSTDNIAHWSMQLSNQSIGPNKVEQWRHVQFLRQYPDGLTGLMRDHARILKPKFDSVIEILDEQLGNRDLASWSTPQGGYFISLDTKRPIASEVVRLAREAGVALTPTGATYPDGLDPHDRNIRLAPTRPELEEVQLAMKVVTCCIQLASAEYDQRSAG